MKKLILTVALAVTSLLVPSISKAAQVTWGAAQSNGIGTANGTPLAIGSLVRVGWFNFSMNVATNNAMIAANMGNPAVLNSHFIEYANSTIGTGDPTGGGNNAGYWLANSVASTLALGIENQQIYYWLFDSTTFATATQYGVFTSGVVAWKFPADAAIPPTTVTDLADVPQNANGIIIGGFGTGTSNDGMSPLFNLVPIPEPGTYALLLVGFAAVGYARRRAQRVTR